MLHCNPMDYTYQQQGVTPFICFGRPKSPSSAVNRKKRPNHALRPFLPLRECIDVSLDTIRNWEQGKRSPTGAAKALLRVLDKAPEAALAALR